MVALNRQVPKHRQTLTFYSPRRHFNRFLLEIKRVKVSSDCRTWHTFNFSVALSFCGSMGCCRRNSFFNRYISWSCVSHVSLYFYCLFFIIFNNDTLPVHVMSTWLKSRLFQYSLMSWSYSVVNLSSFQNTMASGSTSCTWSSHKNIVIFFLPNGSTAALTTL